MRADRPAMLHAEARGDGKGFWARIKGEPLGAVALVLAFALLLVCVDLPEVLRAARAATGAP